MVYRFRYLRFLDFDVQRGEVGQSETFPVERFGEVVQRVDQESPAVDCQSPSDSKVNWCEIFLDFFIRDLHGAEWKVQADVLAVLWTPMADHEHRKWIVSIIFFTDFEYFHRVVAEVVLET